MQAAAKEHDTVVALRAFDRMVKENIAARPELFAVLMYVLAGGDAWEGVARQRSKHALPPSSLFPAEASDQVSI